jgi:transcription elongation factor GreA
VRRRLIIVQDNIAVPRRHSRILADRYVSQAQPESHLTRRTCQALLASKDYPDEPSMAQADPQRPHCRQGVPVTETHSDSLTWLTQEAYDRLKSELDHLSGPGRVDIAKKIEAARDEGDLRENGGYHAAKEEQGKIEGRIIQLQHILQHARVGEPPRTDGVVGPGMTVTIRFAGDDEEVTFLLASLEESGSPIDVYSPRSPLGAAINGKKIGDSATYTLPNGRSTTVEILEAVPYVGG